jgi:hypothetical protein
MMSFDNDRQPRDLRYAGRHRKAPTQLLVALRLARRDASASRPRAGGLWANHSPRRRLTAGSLAALAQLELPSAGGAM